TRALSRETESRACDGKHRRGHRHIAAEEPTLTRSVATEEIAHRQQTRLAADATGALSLSEDDRRLQFHLSVIPRLQMLGSALAPDFVTEGSLIRAGKPGRGKTNVAIAWPIAPVVMQ